MKVAESYEDFICGGIPGNLEDKLNLSQKIFNMQMQKNSFLDGKIS